MRSLISLQEGWGGWKDNLIGQLERDYWPLLWPAVPSAKSSFLPAPYAHCCWVWREACLLPNSTQHCSVLSGFLPSLKYEFPAFFSLQLVPLLNSSLPRPAALILPKPLLTPNMSSWGEIPWLQHAMAKPWSYRRTRHPQNPSPISRISLTDKVVTCLWTERWNCAGYPLLSSTCGLFTWSFQTQKWHVVEVTKLLLLLTYAIIERGFSWQIRQEARENSSCIHMERTNPHGFSVLLSMWVLRNAAAGSLAWIQSF